MAAKHSAMASVVASSTIFSVRSVRGAPRPIRQAMTLAAMPTRWMALATCDTPIPFSACETTTMMNDVDDSAAPTLPNSATRCCKSSRSPDEVAVWGGAASRAWLTAPSAMVWASDGVFASTRIPA
jgi:hypothetical protein